jgi:ATP-dependent exoDNAse (exonuclease V) beta subunit
MQKLFLLHIRRFCRIGKNLCISQEYLKIILTAHKNDAYRNILAITFTNKAVHEMKTVL